MTDPAIRGWRILRQAIRKTSFLSPQKESTTSTPATNHVESGQKLRGMIILADFPK